MVRRGFTFAELIVCLGIISMALLALVSAQLYAMKASSNTGRRHTADAAASSVLAQTQQRLHDDFSQAVSVPRRALDQQAGFEYQVDETEEMPGRLKRVEVTVFWRDEHGSQTTRLWTKVVKQD